MKPYLIKHSLKQALKTLWQDLKILFTQQELSFATVDKASAVRTKISIMALILFLILKCLPTNKITLIFLIILYSVSYLFFFSLNHALMMRVYKLENELKSTEYEQEIKELKSENKYNQLLGISFFLLFYSALKSI